MDAVNNIKARLEAFEEKLDAFEEKAPKFVASLLQLGRTIARRAGQLFSTSVAKISEVTGSADTSTDAGAESAVHSGSEAIDLSEEPAGRIDASDAAGRRASLEELTKAVLYSRAQELDIAGRAQMRKDELISAIMEYEGAEQLAP